MYNNLYYIACTPYCDPGCYHRHALQQLVLVVGKLFTNPRLRALWIDLHPFLIRRKRHLPSCGMLQAKSIHYLERIQSSHVLIAESVPSESMGWYVSLLLHKLHDHRGGVLGKLLSVVLYLFPKEKHYSLFILLITFDYYVL